MEHMKWWGWGHVNKSFDITHNNTLWPFILEKIGKKTECSQITAPPVLLENIVLPEPNTTLEFMQALKDALRNDQLKFDAFERLLHVYGKSCRDLLRIRKGIISRAPDVVCYPESEQDVIIILSLAMQHKIVVIPFGGGTNIVGGVEPRDHQNRTIVSLDMKRMNRVINIDCHSMTASIEAGICGPELESQLNVANMTLGHFPDSFEYSTIGGWVATRSAGMLSNKYGKIEDMVISLRLVTPQGTIATRMVPKSSNGIDIKHLCIGSEGILGVITEVTMQLYPLANKEFHGFIFPKFEKGIAAIHECVIQNCSPSMVRLSDSEKTQLSFAFKSKSTWFETWLSKGIKYYLNKIKNYNSNDMCLMLVGFDGNKKQISQQKKQLQTIYKKFGAVYLGSKPGKAFENTKYDFPYLRDFGMDRNLITDVSETSTTWANLLPMYSHVQQAILKAITATGSKAWCGCHISHIYRTGASLYFTFGFEPGQDDELEQYKYIKTAAENAFMECGGTLSHHHAVGYEHIPWLAEDISPTGINAIRALKQNLDPMNIMNPGKIISNEIN